MKMSLFVIFLKSQVACGSLSRIQHRKVENVLVRHFGKFRLLLGVR